MTMDTSNWKSKFEV